jgi:hypothetical protein
VAAWPSWAAMTPVGSTEFEYDVAQHSKITAGPE